MLLIGVSENTFSLSLHQTGALTMSFQILYSPGTETKSKW